MRKLTYTLLAASLMMSAGADLSAAKKAGVPHKARAAKEIKRAPGNAGWAEGNVFWGLEKTNEYKPQTLGLYQLSPRGAYVKAEGTEKVKANVAGWFDEQGHYFGFNCVNETTVSMSGQYQTNIQSTLTEYDPENDWAVVATNNFDKRKVFYALSAAYNPADGKLYGCFYNPESQYYEYAVVDPATKQKETISGLDYDWIATFFDDNGTLYYIDEDYYLGTVDPATGETSEIEWTGVEEGYYSCAAYDTRSGKAYWSIFDFNSMSEKPICSTMYMVDLETADTEKLFDVDNMDSVNSLYVPRQTAASGAPDFVSSISLDANGGSAKLSFTMPEATVGGEALAGKGTYHFMANGKELATGEADFGSEVSVDVVFPAEDTYLMELYASNDEGAGRVATDMRFIGVDTPASPENVKASWDKGVFSVKWNAVTSTIHHSAIAAEDVTYTVKRFPGEVEVAEGLEDATFTETLYPEEEADYYYTVTAVYGGKESEPASSNVMSLKGMAQNDIELAGLAAPARVLPGKEFVVSATVKNVGINELSGVKVTLYRDGQPVDTKEVESLKYDETAEVAFTELFTVLDSANHEYFAEAVLENDGNFDNNFSLPAAVALHLSPAPLAEEVTGNAGDGVTISWSAPTLSGENVVKEVTDDFESYPSWSYEELGEWTLDDRDGNSPYPDVYFPFGPFEEEFPAMAFCVFDNSHPDFEYDDEFAAHSGNKFLVAMSSDMGANDDWLISPELPLGGQTVSLYAKSRVGAQWGAETFEVLYSTNGMKFNLIKRFEKIPNRWEEYTVDIPEDAKYFAVRSVSDYCDMLLLDDLTYTRFAKDGDYTLLGYNIYRDGVKLNDTPVEATSFVDRDGDGANHTYAVTAVYSDEESRPVYVELSASGDLPFTVTPASSATVKNIYAVTLTPASDVKSFLYDMTETSKAYFNVDGEYFCGAVCSQSMDGVSLEINPECFIYTPGECELVIEPGYIIWTDADGTKQSNTEALSYSYSVEGGYENPEVPFTVTPADGETVESLSLVTVAFSNVSMVFPAQDSYMIYFAQDGKKVCGATCMTGEDGVSVLIAPQMELNQNGQYDLVIMPYGLQAMDNDYNFYYNEMPVVYTYNVKGGAGVAGIASENAECIIYNLNGVKMHGPVESLAPGIYVVNGRKMVVR